MKKLIPIICILFLSIGCSYLPEDFDNQNLVITEDTDFIELRSNFPSVRSIDVLFYPGGLVDPHAYIEALQQLLPTVSSVTIAKHDANLAVLDINKADVFLDNLVESESGIKILMGHSLGGAMACSYASNNLGAFDGLVLMASYPTENFSLVDYSGSVLSLTGSLDGVLDLEKFEEAKAFLPAGEIINSIDLFPDVLEENTTVYFDIEGGNHAQFGSYGAQNGDGKPTISKEYQHAQVQGAIIEFFNAKGW